MDNTPRFRACLESYHPEKEQLMVPNVKKPQPQPTRIVRLIGLQHMETGKTFELRSFYYARRDAHTSCGGLHINIQATKICPSATL